MCVHACVLLYNNLCRVDRNVSIKVADFGLTRDIYETDYYIQRFNAKVPVKWMSPESLHDRISNEATDVVSVVCSILTKISGFLKA